jgi:hypothetical protein
MADIIYNGGLDRLRDFTTGTFKFLLLKGSGYTVDKDHDFVANLTPGTNEVSAGGYARQTAASKTRTVDDTNDRIFYSCANLAFGSIAVGQTVTGMVLYQEVTGDADSVLIAYYDLVDTPTTGSLFAVTIGAAGVAYIDQGI